MAIVHNYLTVLFFLIKVTQLHNNKCKKAQFNVRFQTEEYCREYYFRLSLLKHGSYTTVWLESIYVSLYISIYLIFTYFTGTAIENRSVAEYFNHRYNYYYFSLI